MAQWSVKINNTIKNRTSITIDYSVLKDDTVFDSDSITLEGDAIDMGNIKGQMHKLLRRLKRVDENNDGISKQAGTIFDLSADSKNLVVRK